MGRSKVERKCAVSVRTGGVLQARTALGSLVIRELLMCRGYMGTVGLRMVLSSCGTNGRVEVLVVAQQVPMDSAVVPGLDTFASPPVTTIE